jgi:phosphatidylinositol alpha-mannosyltransferase
MRIALVSPYSWTYPGGVTRHIAALAEQFISQGHDVKVLAPYDPPDRVATISHRGAGPQALPAPPYLIPLGRTLGLAANGAQSNLSLGPAAQIKLVRELRKGDFDVVHIHEPLAPLIGWVAASVPGVPLVGTYHAYSTKPVPNYIATAFGARAMMNHLRVRIAVSEAAAWTGKRWFGGRYTIVPNGVRIDAAALAQRVACLDSGALGGCDEPAAENRIFDEVAPLKLLFVGQAVTRKGLPLLLRAFEALREHAPAELTIIGPSDEELKPLLVETAGIRSLGKVSDEVKHAELAAADVLVAPSLGGESFGMVLTEAMAAGTTVVASDIAGYRDVVSNGVDGILVPPGDAQTLAETLRELYYDPPRRREMAVAGAGSVQRFSWDRVAGEVLGTYERAIAMPVPDSAFESFAVMVGAVSADLQPQVRARRLPTLEVTPVGVRTRRSWVSYARRSAAVLATLAAIYLAFEALKKIGLAKIGTELVNSSPSYVVLGLLVMCSAMAMRAVSWHAILKAALPRSNVRMSDSMQGTMIGVLMSSTLPARLGEPARAMVVARRTGRPREDLPVVLGTVVSQTLLNILALVILGVIMFTQVDFFSNQSALIYVAIAPIVLLLIVLAAPLLLRYGPGGTRFQRARTALESVQRAMVRVRAGLAVFRDPKLGAQATFFQLLAWALQATSCYLLLVALGLSHKAGFAGAAAVLFAVNVTAVLPVTPANLGVFQAACAAVLHTGFHVGYSTGVAYGVILQAVEVATAIILGMPSLLKEGMSWKEVRLRAMNATPVKLPPRPEFTYPPGVASRMRTREARDAREATAPVRAAAAATAAAATAAAAAAAGTTTARVVPQRAAAQPAAQGIDADR